MKKNNKICSQCGNRGWYFAVRNNPYLKKTYVETIVEETPSSEPHMIKVCIVCVKCDAFNKRGLRAQKEIEEKDELANYDKIYRHPLPTTKDNFEPKIVSKDNQLENCICNEWDGEGVSACGFPCPVHSPSTKSTKKIIK